MNFCSVLIRTSSTTIHHCPIQAPLLSDIIQLKDLNNGRSSGLVCEVPVDSFGVVGDAIKLKE